LAIGNSMIVFPNIKINLGLRVTGLRPDGYRSLESVFLPVPWTDILEVVPAELDAIQLKVLGRPVEGDVNDNMVSKAWQLLRKHNYAVGGVNAALIKNIPTGAGLGGGSSDGAWMLRLLNDLFELELSISTLQQLAAQLGSDCPFFIENQPCYVSGRGEILQPITECSFDTYVVVVHPRIHVSTASAFSLITPTPSDVDLVQALRAPRSEWPVLFRNDFESPVFHLHPEIAKLKNTLLSKGAWFASLSGSGSAVYGFFDGSPDVSGLPEDYRVYSGSIKLPLGDLNIPV
jgi:4-diphosphocytidyl-2-C-methyl-D-erythritol kinase